MKKISSFILGCLLGSGIVYTMLKYFEKPTEYIDKYRSYYNMQNQWILQNDRGNTIDKIMKGRGYKTIAIYGMGNVGEHLYNVLKNTDIKVMYGIDSKAVDTDYEIKVYSPDYELPNVDAIVVTIPFAFTSIKDSLEQKTANEIVSLEHILFEV
ncbi:MAG: NAD(P)-dependent oxidoreductase [Christensenellales bacterium]